MKQLRKRIRNSRFEVKIILTFCVLLTANMLLSSLSFYIYANRSASDKFRKHSQDILRQINLHLDEKFTGLARKVSAISSNLSYTTPLNAFLQDERMEYDPVLAGKLANTIFEIETSDDFVDSMYICTSKYIFDDYLTTRKKDVVFEDTEMYRYFVYKPWETVAWFPAMDNPLYESSSRIIPVVYRQKLNGENIYYVVNLSQKALTEYLLGASEMFGNLYVTDEAGKMITDFCYAPDTGLQEQLLEIGEAMGNECYDTVESGSEQYYVAAARMKVNRWRMYGLADKDYVMEDLWQVRIFLILENAVTSILCLGVILWMSHLLTVEMKALAEKMERAEEARYEERFAYCYEDEIGRLGKSFNQMLDTIQKHIRALEEEKEQVKEIQKQKRKAELEALQAQINPHFLYNTLNMITWQAVSQGAEEISLISNALGRYFRISLSKGKESIPIREEIAHARSYLEIQKIRFKSSLNYEISVPEEIQWCYTVKLVLQPLVENALYHGIHVKEEQGHVWIRGEIWGRHLELSVEDDGQGIPEEKLDRLNEKLEKGEVDSDTGYGIYNVNNRLRLYYGEAYGLRLYAGETRGLRAVVTIPVNHTEGMAEDVSHINRGR
ncbi:MAG: histidine kinase [Lachnospiraceae bacterium]|nr:histidine kinase [Lachnospiraceae bacterium]